MFNCLFLSTVTIKLQLILWKILWCMKGPNILGSTVTLSDRIIIMGLWNQAMLRQKIKLLIFLPKLLELLLLILFYSSWIWRFPKFNLKGGDKEWGVLHLHVIYGMLCENTWWTTINHMCLCYWPSEYSNNTRSKNCSNAVFYPEIYLAGTLLHYQFVTLPNQRREVEEKRFKHLAILLVDDQMGATNPIIRD